MRTIYSSTVPSYYDTRKIAKDKWLQLQRGDGAGHRTSRSLFFPDTNLRFHDTKLSVIQKLLYTDPGLDPLGVEIDSSAVTAFDGSYVTLTWADQGGSADSGYNIMRDEAVIAFLDFTDTSYTDYAPVSGHNHVYKVIYHSS